MVDYSTKFVRKFFNYKIRHARHTISSDRKALLVKLGLKYLFDIKSYFIIVLQIYYYLECTKNVKKGLKYTDDDVSYDYQYPKNYNLEEIIHTLTHPSVS